MSDRYKIMVINWEWGEEFEDISRYPSGNKTEGWHTVMANLNSNYLPVKERTGEKGMNAYVVLVAIKLGKEQFKDEKGEPIDPSKSLLDHIHLHISKKLGDNPFDLLILLHHGSGLSQMVQHGDNTCRIDFFGGGKGIIYSERGLLDPTEPTFRNFGNNPAAWFDGAKIPIPISIRSTPFHLVWNHYWYHTRRTIEKLRHWIRLSHAQHLMLHVGVEISALNYARALSQNMLQALKAQATTWLEEMNMENQAEAEKVDSALMTNLAAIRETPNYAINKPKELHESFENSSDLLALCISYDQWMTVWQALKDLASLELNTVPERNGNEDKAAKRLFQKLHKGLDELILSWEEEPLKSNADNM